MTKKDATSSDELLGCFQSHFAKMKSHDITWGIENGIAGMLAGSLAEERVTRLVCGAMPTKEKEVTPLAALQAVQTLKDEQWFRCTPLQAQKTIGHLIGLLEKFNSDVSMDSKLPSQSPMMTQVWSHFGHFLRIAGPSGVLTAGAAMKYLTDVICKKDMKDVTHDCAQIKLVSKFRWMVATGMSEKVDKALAEASRKATAVAKAKAKAKPKLGGAAKVPDQARKSAAAMFI